MSLGRIRRVAILTHGVAEVAASTLREALGILQEKGVEVVAPKGEWEKHAEVLAEFPEVEPTGGSEELAGVDICLVLGGDGTMLRAFRMTRDLSIPVAGVNLGRVGFLTTIERHLLADGLSRLLAGDFREFPLLGLEAEVGSDVFRATNDVVVSKGERVGACSLGLKINGVTLFEVRCDGVVVGTPAGSSAYSLAAGGPLLGISVDAYVISLVAAHAVGTRPVVAAPADVLEILNIDFAECHVDVDGQRMRSLPPGAVARVRTTPAMTSLVLLEGDSLYHHFRDRLL